MEHGNRTQSSMKLTQFSLATFLLLSFAIFADANLLSEILADTLTDPFRVLEQLPFALEKAEQVALTPVKVDWKETPSSHVIMIDVPGMKSEDLKMEVDEANRVLSISGERIPAEEKTGEVWHRVERVYGKFWRQFKMPENVDLGSVRGKLENGVLTVTLEKLSPEKVKKAARVVEIESGGGRGPQEIRDGGAREEL